MEHKQFKLIYDMGHTIDGIEYDTLEQAKSGGIEILQSWMATEQEEWGFNKRNNMPTPTNEQIEQWDAMIENQAVWIVEWNENENNWNDSRFATYIEDTTLGQIGWMPYDDYIKYITINRNPNTLEYVDILMKQGFSEDEAYNENDRRLQSQEEPFSGEKIESYYSKEGNMTFITKETYKDDQILKIEVTGFYFGEPEDKMTEQYKDRRIGTYN